MAPSNPPRVSDDDRSRYEHQAYDVTYGGKSRETGVVGMGKRLSATYEANFQITVDAANTDPQLFTLPPYIYANKLVVAEGGGGSPVATIAVADPADIPGSATNIIVGLDLSAPSTSDVPLTANIDVEPGDQVLQITVTAAGTGYATVLLKADIIQTAWK